jgi:hypothetical protein
MDDLTPGGGHRAVSRGLTATLRGFFYGAAAISAASVFALNHELGRFDEWRGTMSPAAEAAWARAQEGKVALVGLWGLAAAVVAVLVIMWWYQAYRAIEAAPALGRSWSPGWAIGGWFIPVASLVIPKLVLNEIDRVSSAAEEGDAVEWRGRRTLGMTNWWWALWVVGSTAAGMGTLLTPPELGPAAVTDPDVYHSALRFTMLGMAALTGAALFAAASLRILGSRLTR